MRRMSPKRPTEVPAMIITKEELQALQEELLALPEKQRERRESKRQVIEEIAAALAVGRRRGYRLQDLVLILERHGISMSTATLGQYLREQSAMKRKTRSVKAPAANPMQSGGVAKAPRAEGSKAVGAKSDAAGDLPAARSPAPPDAKMKAAGGKPAKAATTVSGGSPASATGKHDVPAQPHASERGNAAMSSGEFTPRRDTDEI